MFILIHIVYYLALSLILLKCQNWSSFKLFLLHFHMILQLIKRGHCERPVLGQLLKNVAIADYHIHE